MGYDTPVVLQFQGGYQLTAWVMNIVAMLFVDRYKRHVLLSIGFFASLLSLIAETALQRYYLNTTNKAGLAACTAMLFVNTTAFSWRDRHSRSQPKFGLAIFAVKDMA